MGLSDLRLRDAVLFPGIRVCFLPIPKAGCTSLLWRLAELEGMDVRRFRTSRAPEVSRSLCIHDLGLWPLGQRLLDLRPRQIAHVLGSPDWFRFTVTRDPRRRLWSAWQSKLLLREPTFTRRFAGEPWFPRVPENSDQIVEDFRRFVTVLADQRARVRSADPHWMTQDSFVGHFPLDHVGRLERLEDTLDALGRHLSERVAPSTLRRENPTLVRFTEGLYGGVEEQYRAVYAVDEERFGYVTVPGDVPAVAESWERETAQVLAPVQLLIERHERLQDMHAHSTRSVPVRQSARLLTRRLKRGLQIARVL